MAVATAPRAKRLHEIVGVGQRWRRGDGLVIFVAQVHRADEVIEAKPVSPATPCRFPLTFGELRAHYEMLVSYRG